MRAPLLACVCLSVGFLAGVACQPTADATVEAPSIAATAPPVAPADAVAAFVEAVGPVLEGRLRAGEASTLDPDAWCPLDAATTALSDPERFLARDVLQALRDELTSKHKMSNHQGFNVPRHPACGT
jgi:hypothetical protein